MESVTSNGNSFSIKTAHGKISKIEQFNAFDKTHQKDWVNIFKEGMTAYNNPEDHDSWETGSTISDFQEPIDLQVEDRLAPVIEVEDKGPHEHQTAEVENANSSPQMAKQEGPLMPESSLGAPRAPTPARRGTILPRILVFWKLPPHLETRFY